MVREDYILLLLEEDRLLRRAWQFAARAVDRATLRLLLALTLAISLRGLSRGEWRFYTSVRTDAAGAQRPSQMASHRADDGALIASRYHGNWLSHSMRRGDESGSDPADKDVR